MKNAYNLNEILKQQKLIPNIDHSPKQSSKQKSKNDAMIQADATFTEDESPEHSYKSLQIDESAENDERRMLSRNPYLSFGIPKQLTKTTEPKSF